MFIVYRFFIRIRDCCELLAVTFLLAGNNEPPKNEHSPVIVL